MAGDESVHETADEVVQVVATLRLAIERLNGHERRYAAVDFNLAADHSFPTLTERQESLAGELACTSKTVRRHAEQALESLALIVVAGDRGRVAMLAEAAGRTGPEDKEDRLSSPESSDLDALGRFGQRAGDQFADLVGVFSSRSDLMSRLPPRVIFGGARQIDAAGLSLNLVCQHYADRRLTELIESGCCLRCLFLDPDGGAVRAREREEGYGEGRLSSLTRMNMDILFNLRQSLSEDARALVEVATYDETLRFNLVLIDERIGIVQPYLHGRRGVDSPAFVLDRRRAEGGLLPVFEQTFAWLWERRAPAC
jgi:hypothetical protein